jgi:hypothetical protein
MELNRAAAVATACLLAAGSQVGAQSIEVIYTKATGHPTAVIPGAVDLNGMPVFTEWRALEDFAFSPDGSRWVIKGRTQLGADLETILVMGSGSKGTMFAQEGQPIPTGQAGEVFDFFGSGLGRWNTLNLFAYSARARGGAASVFQKVIVFDGAASSIVFQMGDAINGLMDNPPNPSGDELFGNSVGSIHILDDGTIGSQDSTIQAIHSSRRPAIMYDRDAFHQSNVTSITNLSGGGTELWKSIAANSFYTTPDGAHWIAQGTVNQATDIDAVLVVDSRVVLQEGMLVPASTVTVADIITADITASGVWYARGDQANDDDWAVVNHTPVAKTGDPIIKGSKENWGNTFAALTASAVGDWVLVGNTTNADPGRDMVMVLNGTRVLVREGDQVDLDSDGTLDDAFIGRGNATLSAFEPNDVFLSPDGYVYFFANLRNAAGQDINSNPAFGTPQAFMRLALEDTSCPADFNADGTVNSQVFFDFLTPFFENDPSADFNHDMLVNSQDFFEFLVAFFAGC